MDITLLHSFIEVARSGSFVTAADRLFVTQSAVSLRIKRLEDLIGQRLFTRSKAGAELTPHGAEFERYAISMIKLWEEAKQQTAIPEGFTKSLVLGAQFSLWPKLGFRWLDRLQVLKPDLSLRAELGRADRFTRYLIEGVVQAALIYTPQLRPGLVVEKLVDDELIMVSTQPNQTVDKLKNYAFIDWGPEFIQAHAMNLPHLTNPGLSLALEGLAVQYVINRGASAYLPARLVKHHLDNGEMHFVPDAPVFHYPAWVVWREDMDPELKAVAHRALFDVVAQIDGVHDDVIDSLRALNPEKLAELGTQPIKWLPEDNT